MRAEAQKWSIMLVTSNAAGMIAIGSYLADQTELGALEDFQRITLAVATLAFAIALLPSIMGAVALGMAARDKSIIDGLRSETRELTRNLMIGGIGCVIGLVCVIVAFVGVALGVLVESI